jgi:hypothetical protein
MLLPAVGRDSFSLRAIGRDLAKVIDVYVRAVDTKGFDKRLTKLAEAKR